MIDDELLESLPSDPEEAFAVFEREMRTNLLKKPEHFNNQNDEADFNAAREENAREYFTAVAAFLDIYGFQVAVDFDELFGSEGEYFWRFYNVATQKIQYFAIKCALKRDQKKKAGSTCIYVLDSGAKTKIHKYISKIRQIINDTDLTDWKREALSNKLNSFALEIDKDRTRLESLASLYILAKKEAQEFKPISDQIEKIWDAVSKGGEELWKALPKPKINGYIEKSQGKIEDHSKLKETFDLDDEIPF